ncbi:MAG: thiamine-phosphate kinase [Phycisphaerae bacterium]|nr:thiamine-phosphate kinase [Phycisphaerae bacterium]NUQ44680.1 thiamine-phosphate kinase [Phycisphaerae bacterium]
MAKSERQFVEWLRARFPVDATRVPIGIGDDMAALRVSGDVLVTADMLMDGVDFDVREHAPRQIGRKALACGLSDCAAMAVRPVAAVVSMALPNAWSMSQAQGLYEGMEPLCTEFDVALAGGDTNSWNGPLVIDVCVLAEAWPGLRPVTRNGARPGDVIFVSGRLGGSIRGRHLGFPPRVALARELRERLGDSLHAMMDLSDGLLLDLSRMCAASGLGAELDARDVSAHASPDAHAQSAADGRPVLEHVMTDGEDFELLCAVGAEAARGMWQQDVAVWSGRPIGRFVASGLWLKHEDGRREVVEARGWEHFVES